MDENGGVPLWDESKECAGDGGFGSSDEKLPTLEGFPRPFPPNVLPFRRVRPRLAPRPPTPGKNPPMADV